MSLATNPQVLAEDFDFQKAIPEWTVHRAEHAITRDFVFVDFDRAFEFMTLCAAYASELDHHPEWFNVWNKVNVRLSTHSKKAITELDILMAQAMDRYAQQIS
ncbi:pterin-4-alpha-carbinolamine dehydratase [Polynucleobacter meluiroseus]|uniref:4a-hydroxytetrahydrobiopterin dehydratase n=1 Tax=Polynucleobacter meluiroseus TaxID=1938814 RepID=A0A240E136_9BURK|nr:4a-hydroxytetrahydrobiopterin dehydratase [Polynucleobacter meluiroseus]SNX29155.1 pterin-4-alpha-carbinolamine dehydratase [Polynucleobacter meluiroseus]